MAKEKGDSMRYLLIPLFIFITGCAPGIKMTELPDGMKIESTGLPMFRYVPAGEYKYVNKETGKEFYVDLKLDLKVVDFNILSKVSEGMQE